MVILHSILKNTLENNLTNTEQLTQRMASSSKNHVRFCQATTKKGAQCKNTCKAGFSMCHVHTPKTAECNICMTDKLSLCKSVTLSCGHSMCESCEKKWKKMGKEICPFCRKYVYIDSMEKCVSTIANLLQECSLTRGQGNKLEVIDKIFTVLSTEHGQNILRDSPKFCDTVYDRIQTFDYQLYGTPEHHYISTWTTIADRAFA